MVSNPSGGEELRAVPTFMLAARLLTQVKANAGLERRNRAQAGECLEWHESAEITHSGTLPMPETAGGL
jgi:hypothetical protein